jgi:hypothetical protein
MAKKKMLKEYRETPEQRKERVRVEGARFRSRIETPKIVYNRKKLKRESREDY